MGPFYTTALARPALGSAQLGLDQTRARSFTALSLKSVIFLLYFRTKAALFQTVDDAGDAEPRSTLLRKRAKCGSLSYRDGRV